jgi:hypothetical protein
MSATGPLAIYERFGEVRTDGNPHLRNFSFSTNGIQQPVTGRENVQRLSEVFTWLIEDYRQSLAAGEPARTPVLIRESDELARIALLPLFTADKGSYED